MTLVADSLRRTYNYDDTMKRFVTMFKEYFFVTYSREDILEFAKAGDLPEEFSIKRRRFRALVLVIFTVVSLLYLVFS